MKLDPAFVCVPDPEHLILLGVQPREGQPLELVHDLGLLFLARRVAVRKANHARAIGPLVTACVDQGLGTVWVAAQDLGQRIARDGHRLTLGIADQIAVAVLHLHFDGAHFLRDDPVAHWSPLGVGHNSAVCSRDSVEMRLQAVGERDPQRLVGFALSEIESFIGEVLPLHLHDIANALACANAKFIDQSRPLGSQRFELGANIIWPRLPAVALLLEKWNAFCRIAVLLLVVATDDFLADNPAAAKLFEMAELDINDVSYEIGLIANGEDSSDDIDRHVDEWIEANRAAYDSWLEAARAAAK